MPEDQEEYNDKENDEDAQEEEFENERNDPNKEGVIVTDGDN